MSDWEWPPYEGEDPERGPGPGGGPRPEPYRRFERSRALGSRLLRPPRSRRGFLVSLALVGGLGTLGAIAGLASQHWTETEGFCSRCHTMAPQAKAYELSVHREVACGECHVEPGIAGFVKAKVNGLRQTVEMLTGTFPKPIRPPDHEMLPNPEDTCMECHSLDRIAGGANPTKIVLHPRYREDRSNTKEMVAVVVRPSGLGGKAGRGAHWHVQQKVEFTSPDENSREIDWVGVTYRDGRTKEFIARPEVGVSSDARTDVRRLLETETRREMDCISCHNRIGHELPRPDAALDESIAAGKISRSLPYIKREGVKRLSKSYDSEEEADQAIDGIRRLYASSFPFVARNRRREVNQAVEELKLIYRLVATPEMKALAATYPSNLGHQTSRGCFRCHDGAHFEVGPEGRVLDRTIPWACTTCHTFPQVGRAVSSVNLLSKPASHKSKLWVFEHKSEVSSLEVPESSGYCANCHNSGASLISHDEMLFRHPEAIAEAGLKACQYCHQPASCARCHKNDSVLESERPSPHRESPLRGEPE